MKIELFYINISKRENHLRNVKQILVLISNEISCTHIIPVFGTIDKHPKAAPACGCWLVDHANESLTPSPQMSVIVAYYNIY